MKFPRLMLTAAALACAPLPALAGPYTYAPDSCEFKIDFPEKPLIEQKCTSGENRKCSEIVTYTKIVTAESSVNFRVICDALDPKELSHYSPAVMQETLKQMLADANLEADPPEAFDRNGYKVAAVVSTGMRGDREVLYTGQLWIGERSMFSLEGDMSGPQDAKADKLFSDILNSMKAKKKYLNASAEAAAKTKEAEKGKAKPAVDVKEGEPSELPADDQMLSQPEDKYAP